MADLFGIHHDDPETDLRTALEAIQELHCENVRSSMLSLCHGCLEVWPCDTRRLADQGLGGEERA